MPGWKGAIDRILHKQAAPAARVAVLAVLPFESDRTHVRSIATREGWELALASDCRAALALLGTGGFPIILCDRDLPDPDWRDALKTLSAAGSQHCVILASAVNDSYLWQEVVQNGGYDVVTKPLLDAEVVAVVRRAWIFWKAAQQRESLE